MIIKFILFLMMFLHQQENKKYESLISEISIAGNNKNSIILNAHDLCFTEDNKLILTDKLHCKIKVFDNQLHQIYSFGKRGIKKGEFKAPSQIACSHQFIGIADFTSSRIQIFNKDLEYVNEFLVEGNIFDFVFINKSELLIGIYTGKKDKSLFKYNIDGKHLGIIPLKHTMGDPFKDIYKIILLPNGCVAIGYYVQNNIEILDVNYKYLQTVMIDNLPKEPEYTLVKGGYKLPQGKLIRSLATDIQGNIYVLAFSYTRNPKRDIFVYRQDGTYLNTIILPYPADEIYFDTKNNFYTIETERTIVKKYKLTMNLKR